MKKDKDSKFKILFDKAQDSYTRWEDNLWDKLGPLGARIKKRRQRKIPDWKRVQNVWIWLSILALLTGYNLSGYYFQYKCNAHIVEEFYPEIACQTPGLKCDMSRVNPEMLRLINETNSSENIKSLPLLGINGDGIK